MLELVQQVDEWIMLFIQNNIRCEFLNVVMVAITYMGSLGALWICVSGVLMAFKSTRSSGIRVLVTMGICWCISELLIKDLIGRSRPFITMETLNVLVSLPMSYSLPSGHACSSFAAAYVLAKEFGKKGSWAFVPAALIAVSRVYIGVHYPSDIIAGAVFGTLCAMLIYNLTKKYVHIRDHKIVVKRYDDKCK